MQSNYLKKTLLIFIYAGLIIFSSCSKDEEKSSAGTEIYYVVEGVYDPRPDQEIPEGQVEALISMTMPKGNESTGDVLTPYTSSTREYESGMTVTVTAESVLSYTTIKVKIYKDGALWKESSATATGWGNYAKATVSGTL